MINTIALAEVHFFIFFILVSVSDTFAVLHCTDRMRLIYADIVHSIVQYSRVFAAHARKRFEEVTVHLRKKGKKTP